MKNKFVLFLLLFIPSYLFSDLQYPESLYVVHKESGYRILLGSTLYQNIERNFGNPTERKLISRGHNTASREPNGASEIWEITYPDFILQYNIYYGEVTSITLLNDTFKTSLDINIGDREDDLLKAYGEPSEIVYLMEKSIIYNKFIPEINVNGAFIQIIFQTSLGFVDKIIFLSDSYGYEYPFVP
jgi:hypothetical protein